MRIVISATFLAVLSASLSAQVSPPKATEKLIVHEWGVQIPSLATVKPLIEFEAANGDGNLKSVLAPPGELIDDLPSFVLRHDSPPQRLYRPWTKPVIHLYGPQGLEVGIEVRTPQGTPTAYWPKPTLIEETFWVMGTA